MDAFQNGEFHLRNIPANNIAGIVYKAVTLSPGARV